MNEPTDLLTEARELGADVAWAHNYGMEVGITDVRWARRIQDAQDRLDAIVDVVGDGAQKAYADGYDAHQHGFLRRR